MPTAATAEFFASSWTAYQAIVEHDYLWHAMASDALRKHIDNRFGPSTPIRFLDLACGDAASTTRMLTDRPLARYVGVDQSVPALAAAKQNVERLRTTPELIVADFLDFLRVSRESFDVIYIGLSAHHIGEAGLPRFLEAIRRRLSPNGFFAAYEPFLMHDEVQQDYIDRFTAIAMTLWVKMTPEQRALVCNHVATCDFPTHLETWSTLAEKAGMRQARVAFKSPDFMCWLVVHELASGAA
jgi:SAM-dependent methyltransferase